MPAADVVTIVHSSDLHVDEGPTARAWGGDGAGPLAAVLDTAHALAADLVLLTGDVFEHNRLKAATLERARTLLAAAPIPVVLLPGNHDPLMPGSVWDRGGLLETKGVHVLGAAGDRVVFDAFDLEIWGRAHTDYDDMAPLAAPPPRRARRHIAAAHGHFVEEAPPAGTHAPGWLILPDEIAATRADYVALGHWNEHVSVGTDAVPAFYSGAPDYARTVNVVRLSDAGVEVVRKDVRGLPD